MASYQRHSARGDWFDHGVRDAGIPTRRRGGRGEVGRSMIPAQQIAERSGRVRRRFDQGDALLVTDLSNIRWLTGFTGSNGWALLTPDEVVLVTDGRYGDQATAQMAEAGVDGRMIVGLSGAAMLDSLAAEVNAFGSVGF